MSRILYRLVLVCLVEACGSTVHLLADEPVSDTPAQAQRLFAEGLRWDYQNPPPDQDFAKAIHCYRQAAELGHPEAPGLLALLGIWGDRGWCEIANDTEPPNRHPPSSGAFASYCQGYRFAHGLGVDVDTEKAKRYYSASLRPLERLASENNAYAQLLISHLHELQLVNNSKGTGQVIQLVQSAANQGLPLAQAYLGQAYLLGDGVEMDQDRGLALVNRAAEQRCAFAESYLGMLHFEGYGTLTADVRTAVDWFRRAAEQGYPEAEYNLAVIYRDGVGGFTADPPMAAKLFRLAANGGYATARNNLGLMYKSGEGGLPQSDDKATSWFRQAAAQGDALGRVNLAIMYLEGRGGDVDREEGKRLLELAADQGFASAQIQLGMLYLGTYGSDFVDQKKGADLFEMAARQGDPTGQYNLGHVYSTGSGRTKDLRQAVKWFRLAANQGMALAQYNLGLMYFNGQGGLGQDYSHALNLFQKAADQGFASAHFNLGVMYYNGQGVRQDDVLALRYFRAAASRGHEGARAAVNKMVSY